MPVWRDRGFLPATSTFQGRKSAWCPSGRRSDRKAPMEPVHLYTDAYNSGDR